MNLLTLDVAGLAVIGTAAFLTAAWLATGWWCDRDRDDADACADAWADAWRHGGTRTERRLRTGFRARGMLPARRVSKPRRRRAAAPGAPAPHPPPRWQRIRKAAGLARRHRGKHARPLLAAPARPASDPARPRANRKEHLP